MMMTTTMMMKMMTITHMYRGPSSSMPFRYHDTFGVSAASTSQSSLIGLLSSTFNAVRPRLNLGASPVGCSGCCSGCSCSCCCWTPQTNSLNTSNSNSNCPTLTAARTYSVWRTFVQTNTLFENVRVGFSWIAWVRLFQALGSAKEKQRSPVFSRVVSGS